MARFYEITCGDVQVFNGRCNLETARAKAFDAMLRHANPAIIWRAWHPKVSRAKVAFERVTLDGRRLMLTS